MNKYQLQILGLALTLCASNVLAQQPDLPDGFGLNQLQTTENLSSGVLNINLPIESYLVPISLSYTTSGIRVAQRADIVGLGWNLMAGGYITRQKRGISDGSTNGYSGHHKYGSHVANASATSMPPQSVFDNLTYLKEYKQDPEPDIYSFHYPGGSGRFTMDHNRNIVKLSPNDLKIERTFNSTDGYTSFKITDTRGNEYHFGENENGREYTSVEIEDEDPEDFRSKWHLTRIVNYSTGDEISLSYQSGTEYSTSTTYSSIQRYGDTPPGSYLSGTTTGQEVTVTNSRRLLHEISYKNTRISFFYSNRQDIVQLSKLDRIEYVLYGNTNLTYYFNYKYLGTGTSKRLMLNAVSKSINDKVLYQFDYYGEEIGEKTLPAYDSKQQDHWGFHNSNSSNTLFPPSGATRSPNLLCTRSNTLKRVHHRSGAFEEYIYHLNEANNYGEEVGGLRIYRVYQDDGQGNRYLLKSYDYDNPNSGQSSGELLNEPNYYKRFYNEGNSGTKKRFVIDEFSAVRLYDDLGRHIAYEYVTVTDIDGGATQFKYYTFSDDQSLGTDEVSVHIKGYDMASKQYQTALYTTSADKIETGARNFHGTCVGLPEEKILKNEIGQQLLKETYSYEYVSPSSSVRGMNYLRTAQLGQDADFLISFYDLKNGYRRLASATTTTNDPLDENINISSTKSISYYSGNQLIKNITLTSPERPDESHVTEMKYYFQEASGSDYAELIEHNLLSIVASQSLTRDGNPAESIFYRYLLDPVSTKLQQSSYEKYANGNKISEISTDYDANGRLCMQINEMTGNATSQFWSENGMHRIALVDNAAFDQCGYADFEDNNISGWVISGTLKSDDDCNTAYYDCIDNCSNDPACFSACSNQQSACNNTITNGEDFQGTRSYDLDNGNITKVIPAGKYFLSYLKKNGTVNISGISTNHFLGSKTISNWNYEERLVSRTSPGTLTISGSGDIDELKIYPHTAFMSTTTNHDVFGITSRTDTYGNMVFYEYDEMGRLTLVKDENGDILEQNEFHIASIFEISANSFSTNHLPSMKTINVKSNLEGWTLSDNKSWISLSKSTGDYGDSFEISLSANNGSNTRTGTVTVSHVSAGTKNISISQTGTPSAYIYADFTGFTGETGTIDIQSNVSWNASLSGSPGLNLSSSSGSNNGSIQISCYGCTQGQNGGQITISGGGASDTVYVTF